jgi:signal transduction histidine kinase
MKFNNCKHSLSGKLFRNINTSILFFYLIMIGSVSVLVYTSIHQFFEKQVNSWVSEMPHQVLPSLIDSDNFSIENEVKFLGSSGLFSKFLIFDNQKNLIATYNNNDAPTENENSFYIPINDKAGITWGFFSYVPDFKSFIVPFVWLGLILFLLFAFIYFLTRYKLNKYLNIEFEKFSIFLNKLEIFSKNISELKTLPKEFMQDSKENSEEYNKINRVINHLVDEIEKSHQKLQIVTAEIEKRKAKDAFANIAAQVAHDIRSPLAALSAIVKQTQNIPENQRIMLRNAAQQINDIANNLLEQYRIEKNDSNTLSPEIISLLLDTVISEKRAQYSDAIVKIDLNIHPDAFGIFSKVVAVDFKRVISNLINNSVDAMQNKGKVCIELFHQEKFINIKITDTGSGMPKELIQKIMVGESVSNKKSGHGIGLASSKKMIESWNGNLTITSEIGKGTTLIISLPFVSPDGWFADKLSFIDSGLVIILDDDQSIHDVWESRFETEVPHAHLQRIHYYNPQELLKADLSYHKNLIYLCDYELIGHKLTGLDVIEQLGLKNEQAVLVTSRYEEPKIRERCKKIGIKILPKSYAIYAPMIITQPVQVSLISNTKPQEASQLKPDLILIDDNPTLTDAWKMFAEFESKNIVVFNSVSEVKNNINLYALDTTIYIDSDLGNNIKGEEYAKELYDKGYQNIYLATGYDESKFDLSKFYWIKKIVGKDPQFDDL